MPKVFICYRREDSDYAAHRIYDELTNHFGSESVFLDIETIPLGIDFHEYLSKQISESDVMLVVIGDQWLKLLRERLDDPADYVRVEIEAALERNIVVVPVLVDHAPMPHDEDLPPELVSLAYRQAAGLSDWDGQTTAPAFQKLITDIAAILGPPPLAAQEQERRKAEAEAAAARKAKEEAKRLAQERKDLEARQQAAKEETKRLEQARRERQRHEQVIKEAVLSTKKEQKPAQPPTSSAAAPEGTDTSKAVFLSYRRKLSKYVARSVYQYLISKGYDVFMDVESIDSGEFPPLILHQIEARPHFLVILTRGSLERTTKRGDWLRREIEHAMQKKRNVVPVLISDFSFEAEEQELLPKKLPAKLRPLTKYNGVDVPDNYFEAAMEKLTDRFLNKKVDAVTITPTPANERPEVQRMIETAKRDS